MIVVAGPSGSGKSLFFPVRRLATNAFNVDDRAAVLHGGYGGIPAVVRAQAQRECEAFVLDQIAQQHTFAVETTLRSDAALKQAAIARSKGFRTVLIYVCTQDVDENVKRVALRGKVGGHAAPAAEIHDIYSRSLENLSRCRDLFDHADLHDSTIRWAPPRRVIQLRDAKLTANSDIPAWVPEAWHALR